MANGVVEIHDPFDGQNGISRSPVSPKLSVSQSEDAEDTVEFRLLMAYATRRRPKETAASGQHDPSTPNGNSVNGTATIQTEKTTVRRKKKLWKRLPKVLACLKPQTKEEMPPKSNDNGDGEEEEAGNATFRIADGVHKEDSLEDVAARLAEISDDIPFVPPEIETDSPDVQEDVDVEKVIGLLLRDAGDRLYERELKGTNITDLLGNYSFFERVIFSLLTRMGLSSDTETLGPKVSTKTQIAVTCEATSRLSVLETLPMNRLLGHGARFLKTHFSSWAEQHGGYENAFESEDDEEVQ